jgi:molybdate transport system regulatory protein
MGPARLRCSKLFGSRGSIRAAARHLGMAYRTAWLMVEQINEAMREPAVTTATGGQHGGGAAVTRSSSSTTRSKERCAPRRSGNFRRSLGLLASPDHIDGGHHIALDREGLPPWSPGTGEEG